MKSVYLAAGVASAIQQDHCYGLILDGGGSAAAYETGYIWGLLNYDDPANVQAGKYVYNMITGNSGGSINALTFAAWPKGQEKDLIQWNSDKWRTLKNTDVFKLWDVKDPIRDGIFNESGIFDDKPLSNTMHDVLMELGDKFSHQMQRMITVQAMDANTGALISFTEKDVSYDQYSEVTIASASLPGLFPSYKWGDWVFFDGGVVYGANLISAVQRCREVVDSDDKITVDIMLTHAGKMTNTVDPKSHDTIAYELRYREIKKFENGLAGILKFMVDFPEINYRYFGIPSKNIGPGPTRLDFNDRFTWPMQELGREDAKADLAKGEGYKFKKLLEYSKLTPQQQSKMTISKFFETEILNM